MNNDLPARHGRTLQSAIIHLSDIECGLQNRAEVNAVVDGYNKCAISFIKDVQAELIHKRRLSPEQIGLVITGDISHGGTVEEFEKAAMLVRFICDSLKIPRRQVAIVPGNHDVCWDDCRKAFQTKFPNSQLTDTIARQNARTFPEKLSNFSKFLSDLCDISFDKPESVLAFDGFTRLGIALIGFDTTFPCTFCPEDNFGELRDDSILKAGKNKLEYMLAKNRALIPIAIAHHCPDPLADQNQDGSYLRNATQAVKWLQRVGLLTMLCGHEHQARSTLNLRTGNTVFVTGSFGLNVEGLLKRYGGQTVLESNKYQILLIYPGEESQMLFRRLRNAGDPESDWEKDGNGEYSSNIFFRFLRRSPSGIKDDSLIGQINPWVTKPVPAGNRWFIAVGVQIPSQLLAWIQSVSYTIDGRVFNSMDSANEFSIEAPISQLDSSIDIKIAIENAESIALGVSIPRLK
jgi:3',5'-cyclic AMP phosphodiesterase CpdA